jgi:hypothetical protein
MEALGGTSALDGGEWSASRPSCALPSGKGPPVPIGYEAGWAPELVWTTVTLYLRETVVTPRGFSSVVTLTVSAVLHSRF